ncbi:glycosyltransferase [Halopseudomonas xiamenensis]|uniref:glycosyltransferase n=1 Tax=Halopseudomonas xiamenensis TaxID=157792 RepID=UPI0016231B06|nr:glycosyltransferase [Halopseudomonas xiamenensis]
MGNRVKVLQIQLRYNVNASDLAEQVIAGLPTDYFGVTTLFLRGKPGPDEPVSAAERSVYFDLDKSDLKGLKRWSVMLKLYRFCRDEGFDVVIAHRFKPISMMMWLSRILTRPAFIGVQHGIGDYDRRARVFEANILVGPQWHIVGVSQAVKRYLLSRVSGFNESNTSHINNAIDIERATGMLLDGREARRRLGLAQGCRIVGCIGRLVPVKGHTTLIAAFAKLAASYPDVLIAIIGEGRSREELERLIAEHSLQKQVILLGAHHDALQYVRAFDVFAMPSLSEGLPLALLEALAGQRPVIGSDIPSLAPILEECSGRSFQVGNADDLARELEPLLSMGNAQLQALGRAGYAYLCEQHSIHDFRKNYRQLIESMVMSKGDRRL